MAQGPEPEQVDETVWGKSKGLDPQLPPYPLVRHLLDAAAMALFLWDSYLSDGQRRAIAAGLGLAQELKRARQLVGLCAGLHDIGKVSGFQFCDLRAKAYLSEDLLDDCARMEVKGVAHDLAGMQAAPAVLAALGFGEDLELGSALSRVAEIIGGHHGRYHRFEADIAQRASKIGKLGGRTWARQREAHAAAVLAALGAPEPPEMMEAAAAVLVTGVVILADWLVSQEKYLHRRQRRLRPLDTHFATSVRDAARLASEAGLLAVGLERKAFREAYDIQGEPNPLQRSLVSDLPAAVRAESTGFDDRDGKAGILLVTAAPGDGKSEAALEAERVLSTAFGTRGFAFLLPTMATSNQMHGRVAGVLARQSGDGAGLTLTHSMAWLSAAYADDDLGAGEPVIVCDELDGPRGEPSYLARMRPRWWLRGPKRPLLAQFTVGTVDQALMAVLPVRHNALRMLALSGKTFIVDEAHAYDPYMQVLLGRLLNWLGCYGVPVVLLSATLPSSVSNQLITEYLKGAGHTKASGRWFEAPYPGWLYVDAATGAVTEIAPEDGEEQAAERPLSLHVDVRPVGPGGASGAPERLSLVTDLVSGVVSPGEGCALVVCNTVAEAQATYVRLREEFVGRGLDSDELLLLHARFPADDRERLTEIVTAGMGRKGPRPVRRVIVATQVVEQSLDLDADVVISDLAPLALLLQRAGRCWRHETWWAGFGRPSGRERPAWAKETGPRLVVLDPLLGGGGVPKVWGEVYHEYLLGMTSQLLAERGTQRIAIPEDVQELVEAVHGTGTGRFDWGDPDKSAAWSAYAGRTAAERSMGKALVIPRARNVVALHDLHHLDGTEDEWEAATRLGADSVRLLCAFAQDGGEATLDVDGEVPLPGPGADGRMAVDDVRTVMGRTIPVNAEWFRGERDRYRPPVMWEEHPMLGDLLVLAQPVAAGVAQPVTVGGKQVRLDAELGLVRE
jgi:CRISPR-associated endonuclease/helicase Cas3